MSFMTWPLRTLVILLALFFAAIALVTIFSDPNGVHSEFVLKATYGAQNYLTWRASVFDTRFAYPFGETASFGESYRAPAILARLLFLLTSSGIFSVAMTVAIFLALLVHASGLYRSDTTTRTSAILCALLTASVALALLPSFFLFLAIPAYVHAFGRAGVSIYRSFLVGLLLWVALHTASFLFILTAALTIIYCRRLALTEIRSLISVVLILLPIALSGAEIIRFGKLVAKFAQESAVLFPGSYYTGLAVILLILSGTAVLKRHRAFMVAALSIALLLTGRTYIRSEPLIPAAGSVFEKLNKEENNHPIMVIGLDSQSAFELEFSDSLFDGVRRVANPFPSAPDDRPNLSAVIEGFPSVDSLNALEKYPSVRYIVFNAGREHLREATEQVKKFDRSLTPIARDRAGRILLAVHPTIDANDSTLFLPPAKGRARYIEFDVKLGDGDTIDEPQELLVDLVADKVERVIINPGEKWRKVRIEIPGSVSDTKPHSIRLHKMTAERPGNFLIRNFRLYERWEIPDAI